MTERANSKKEGACPDWIKSLIFPDPDDPESFTPPQCVMTAQLDPLAVVVSSSRTKAAYYRFDPSKTLGLLLRNTHFVEFPTIEIWEEFRGTVVDTQGAVTQQPEEPKLKRRKLATKAGKKAITGLLGGYGSDSEEEADTQNVMALLGGYAGSDEDDVEEVKDRTMNMDDLGDEDADGDTDDDIELDPAALLELMRQAQGSERWAENIGDDDLVDWGDESGEDEPE